MNRRKLLILGGLVTGGGYLSWNWYRSPKIPDGMNVDTLHLRQDVLAENGSEKNDPLEPKEERHVIIESEENAATELINSDSIDPFVQGVNSDNSYVIVVQTGMQTQPDLVLDAINHKDDRIHIEISVDSPRAVDDDLRTHSLLIKITDENSEIPETVTVDIEGYR